jgi:hypothetical protein
MEKSRRMVVMQAVFLIKLLKKIFMDRTPKIMKNIERQHHYLGIP